MQRQKKTFTSGENRSGSDLCIKPEDGRDSRLVSGGNDASHRNRCGRALFF